MILDSPEVTIEALEEGSGWTIKPEGACRGGVCVPLDVRGPVLELKVLAERLGMGVAHDERHQLWALGPSSVSGRALESAEAPDFALPDLDGKVFRFSSLRGRKVVLVAWASW
jgi:hypothetical protein